MTYHENEREADETQENSEIVSAEEVDENVPPVIAQQHRLATERNRLRWEHQERFEKNAIESFLKEDDKAKQRRSILQAMKMNEIVASIQEILNSGLEHDVAKAIGYLEKLASEPFTTMSLLYAPFVVKTVYMCCKYEKSSEIREFAEKCYKRFEPCFGVPEDETFETAFQTQVKKFWEKQNSIMYELEKYDLKQFAMDNTSVETGDRTMEKELKPKNNTNVKMESIKCETDTKALKKEMKVEASDSKSGVKREISVKTEECDDKDVVKNEIKKMKTEYQPKTESSECANTVVIKKEAMDIDDIEIIYCKITEAEKACGLRELQIKLEPVDMEKLGENYDSDKDCYILN